MNRTLNSPESVISPRLQRAQFSIAFILPGSTHQDHRQGRAGPRPVFPHRQARPTGPGLGFVPSKARKPGTGLGFVSSKARKPGTGLGFGKNSHKALYFRASPENPGPGFPSGVNFTVHCSKLVVDAALPINTRALIYRRALRIVTVACNRNMK